MLRILSTMMVILGHLQYHGGLLYGALQPWHYNWFIGHTIDAFTLVAVNCFVLISGYYLCQNRFKLKKLAAIWVQTFVYSVGIYLVAALISGTFVFTTFIQFVFPVCFERYWFMTAYILLYAVSPFLNIAIAAMDKRKHLLCICVLLGIFSVLENLFLSNFSYIKGGHCFLWLCVMYLVGAYMKLYVPIKTEDRSRYLLAYIFFSAFIVIERCLANWITPYIFGEVVLDGIFTSHNSVPTVAGAIALFLFFRTLRVKGKLVSKAILFFTPLCLASYLVHVNVVSIPLIWGWLKPYATADKWWMALYSIGCTVGIFLVCCLIEWVRQKMFHLLRIDLLVDKTCDRIQEKCTQKLNTVR